MFLTIYTSLKLTIPAISSIPQFQSVDIPTCNSLQFNVICKNTFVIINFSWNEWIKLPLKYKDLPRSAQVLYCIYCTLTFSSCNIEIGECFITVYMRSYFTLYQIYT